MYGRSLYVPTAVALACWLIVATGIFDAGLLYGEVFTVNDAFAGQGTLDTLGVDLSSTEAFLWPSVPTAVSEPFVGEGQFPDGARWVGGRIDHADPSLFDSGQTYTLSVSLAASDSQSVREQLQYDILDGDLMPTSPLITVTSSLGLDRIYHPGEIPPGDNSNNDIAYLLRQTSMINVPEPSTSLLGFLVALLGGSRLCARKRLPLLFRMLR